MDTLDWSGGGRSTLSLKNGRYFHRSDESDARMIPESVLDHEGRIGL